jgi:hypothetical protein
MRLTRAALHTGLAATLAVAAGCKARKDGDHGSAVRAAGSQQKKAPGDLSGVETLDAMDISFLLPQARPQALLRINVSDVGRTEAGEELGPLLDFRYFDEMTRVVPDFMEARDLFTTGAGVPIPGKTKDDVFKNLFISAFRYDPCAATEYKADAKSDALLPPTPDAACEPELRLVAQHWFPNLDPVTKQPIKDDDGHDDFKVGDNGFHLVYRIDLQERVTVLQELIRLKALYKDLARTDATPVKDTNGQSIGLHPGFELKDPAKAKEFGEAVRDVIMGHMGFKRLKGVASMITRGLTNPNRTRWQWTLTVNANGLPVPQAAPFAAGNHFAGRVFDGPSKNIGFEVTPDPNTRVQTGNIVPKSTSLAYGGTDARARLKAGTTGSPVSGMSPPSLIETLLSPPQIAGKAMSAQASLTTFAPTAFTDAAAKPTTATGPLLLAIEAAFAAENPRLRFLKPQPHLGPENLLAGINDCTSCHIETPARLRAEKFMQGFDATKVRTRFPDVPGITGTMRQDVRDEYIAGAETAESYIVLNMAWHTKFTPAGTKAQIFPSTNGRTINETVDVVKFIREEMPKRVALGGQPSEPEDPKDPTGGNVEKNKPENFKFAVNLTCARSGGRRGDIAEIDLKFDENADVGFFRIRKVGSDKDSPGVTVQTVVVDRNDRDGIEVTFDGGSFEAEAVEVMQAQRSRLYQVATLQFKGHPSKERVDSNLFCVRSRKK